MKNVTSVRAPAGRTSTHTKRRHTKTLLIIFRGAENARILQHLEADAFHDKKLREERHEIKEYKVPKCSVTQIEAEELQTVILRRL